MNKEEFTGYLEDSKTLTSESIISLNELITEFPYCQSSRILLTLNLFSEKNIRYDSELKTTAVYVSNRGLLRKYIDRLSTDTIKVTLPDEEVIEPKQHVEVEKTDAKVSVEQKEVAKTVNTKVSVEDDAESIAEVKSILERHIHELELENEQKRTKTTIPKKSSKPGKKKSDIVDDFIKNEPSISRPKAKFYNPVDNAKESIVDNENIVSETLAGIYYDQGHLIKAIKIYQKLSLKFPEKSSYFAALIKKAEKELES
ncbi:MAG: hypothetical protein QM503_12345 [Bacteroidota bacterium]